MDQKDPRMFILTKLFADEENYPVENCGDWKAGALKAWKLVGVDLPAGFEIAEKNFAKEKQAALSLGKPELKQGKPNIPPPKKKVKKFKMSAAAKAKITAQAKARWAKVKAKAKQKRS